MNFGNVRLILQSPLRDKPAISYMINSMSKILKSKIKTKNGIAIWFDSDRPDDFSTHINYWITRSSLRRKHFVDFGLKINKWSGGNFFVFFPFKANENSIHDLGNELKDRNLCCAIFNENCKVKESKKKEFLLI